MAKLDIDFRLLDVSFELSYLEDYRKTMEAQIDLITKHEKADLEDRANAARSSEGDFDREAEESICSHRVDFLLPRFFRNPLLVSLYSVYESSTTEIAKLIKERLGQKISIDNLKGGFLERAKLYYKDILHFQLYTNPSDWQQIKMLSVIRNAIAHTNGRMDMLKRESQEHIRRWEQQGVGVEIIMNYVVVDRRFVEDAFSKVRSSLFDLVHRYKSWDDSQK